MTSLLRTLARLVPVYYAENLAYRAEIILWALSTILPFILMGVWVQAGATGSFGLGPLDFARYFFAVFVVRQLTVVWVIWLFEEEVVSGGLSFRLLQPVDPAWHHYMRHLAERMARFPILLALGGLFFLLYPEAAWLPSPSTLALFLILSLTAFSLRFIIQHTFGLLAFWTERASSIQHLWWLLYLFLSGLIAPLEVYPEAIRAAALYTPFPYLVHFPAQVLVGHEVNLARGVGIMAIWGMGFYALNRALWRRGLRRYSGMGA